MFLDLGSIEAKQSVDKNTIELSESHHSLFHTHTFSNQPLHFVGFPIQDTAASSSTTTTSSTSSPSSPLLNVTGLRHTKGKALAPHITDKEGRRYARTEERLAVGMSGGPVLDAEGRCVGVFQGILPPPSKPKKEDGGRRRGDGDGEGEGGEEVEEVLRPLQKRDMWALHAAFIPLGPVLKFLGEKGLYAPS